jgi:phage-related protein
MGKDFPDKIIQVVFYRSTKGNMPVKDWLLELSREDRKIIGEDLKTVELGWPLGMPLVKKLEKGIWEVRVRLKNRSARVLFTIFNKQMVLLHGFIKKSRKTPQEDLELALNRLRNLEGG